MGHTVLSDSMVAMSFIVFFLTVGKTTAIPTGTISPEILGITEAKFNYLQNLKNIYNNDNQTLISSFKIELSTTTTEKIDNLLFNTDYDMEKENDNSTGTDKYDSSDVHSTDGDISNIPIEKRPCYPNCLYLSSLSANDQYPHQLPYLLNENSSLSRQRVGDKYSISNNDFAQAVNKTNKTNTYGSLVSFDPQSMINFTCYPNCNYLASLLARDKLRERNKLSHPHSSDITRNASTNVVTATDDETETEKIPTENKLANQININNDLTREQDNQNCSLQFNGETNENLNTSEYGEFNTAVRTNSAVIPKPRLTYNNWLLANESCHPNCNYYSSLLAKGEEHDDLPSLLNTSKNQVQRSTDKEFDSHEALNRQHGFKDYPSERYIGSAAVLSRSNDIPSSVYNSEVFNLSETHLTTKKNEMTQTFLKDYLKSQTRSETESGNDSVTYHQVPNIYYQEQIQSNKLKTNNSRLSSDVATLQNEDYDDYAQSTEGQRASQYFSGHNGAFLVGNEIPSDDSNTDYEDDNQFSEDMTYVTESQNMRTNEVNFTYSAVTTTESVDYEKDENFDNERYIIYQNSNNPSLYSGAPKNSSTSESDKDYLQELRENNNLDSNGCNKNTENCSVSDFRTSKLPNASFPVNSSIGQPVPSNDERVITYYIKNGEVPIPILLLTDERYEDGSYRFKYVSADGSTRQEVGSVQPDGSWAQVGEFAYRTDNGGTRQVRYRADKRGYRQQDSFIPAASNLTKDETEGSARIGNPLERPGNNG